MHASPSSDATTTSKLEQREQMDVQPGGEENEGGRIMRRGNSNGGGLEESESRWLCFGLSARVSFLETR